MDKEAQSPHNHLVPLFHILGVGGSQMASSYSSGMLQRALNLPHGPMRWAETNHSGTSMIQW